MSSAELPWHTAGVARPLGGLMPSEALSVCESIREARVDPQALGQLLEQYRPLLHMRAEQELGPQLRQRFDASDLVQETLLAANAKYAQFVGDSESRLSAWLFAIFKNVVRNVIRDHVKTEKRAVQKERPMHGFEESASLIWHEPRANQSTPSQQVIRGERAIRLAQLVHQLPEDQRRAVTYRFFERRDLQEIADELGRSYAAAANLIRRGVEALRQKMSEESWC